MNAKHLFWIVPLCLLGGFMINYFLQVGLSMLGWELAEMTGKAYHSCSVGYDTMDKCLYVNNASDYEVCYWKGKEAQANQIILDKVFKNIEVQ